MKSPSPDLAQAIVEGLKEATAVVDFEGRLLCCNQRALKLLGLEYIPEKLQDCVARPDELSKPITLARRSSGGCPAYRFRNRHGKELFMALRPLPAPAGQPPSMLIATIRTRSVANQKMLALKSKLEQAEKSARQLSRQKRQIELELKTQIPRLQALSLTDPLTGCGNRRHFEERVSTEWHRASRLGEWMSLIYADVDHFKQYNDHFGHSGGDECLKTVARCLRNVVTREFDRVCRVGGEEFVLLLPMTDPAGAESLASEILAKVRKLALSHPATEKQIVTLSLGVGSCIPNHQQDVEAFVERVDQAMYRAKELGRDRLERCGSDGIVDFSLPVAPGVARQADAGESVQP